MSKEVAGIIRARILVLFRRNARSEKDSRLLQGGHTVREVARFVFSVAYSRVTPKAQLCKFRRGLCQFLFCFGRPLFDHFRPVSPPACASQVLSFQSLSPLVPRRFYPASNCALVFFTFFLSPAQMYLTLWPPQEFHCSCCAGFVVHFVGDSPSFTAAGARTMKKGCPKIVRQRSLLDVSWPPRAGSKPVQIVKMTMVRITHGIVSMPSSWYNGSMICSSGTLRDCREHCLDVVFVFRQVPIQQIDQSYGLQGLRSFPILHSSLSLSQSLFSASKCVLVFLTLCLQRNCVSRFLPPPDSCRPRQPHELLS